MDWPDWWSWDIELTVHILKRMVDRRFNETDLRLMLENATGFEENHEQGRYVIETHHEGRNWAVIVEPSPSERVLVMITAYPVD
jgi:hypothetical protein